MNITVTPELVGIGLTLITSIITLAYVFGGLKKTVDILVTDVRSLKDAFAIFGVRLGKVEGELSGLNTRISLVESRFTYAGNSPIKLTPVGQKIFDDINGSVFVDNHYNELKEIVRSFGMDTKYDVQQNSIIAVEKVIDNKILSNYKTYAYKEGKRLEQIFEAVGVYLRDRILEEQDNL